MIHLITGGQRSGKSLFAENLVLSLSENPTYLATSRVWDDDHRQRIETHKDRRGNQWTTIEEEKKLSKHDFSGKVVLLDCITLWMNNFFFDNWVYALLAYNTGPGGAEAHVDKKYFGKTKIW